MKIKFEFEGNELKAVLAIASLLSQIQTQDEDENEMPQSTPVTTGTEPAKMHDVVASTNTDMTAVTPPVTSAPVVATPTNTAPAQVPTTAMPTAEQTYTAEQLGIAGGNLINADPSAWPKLQALMSEFGVANINDLPRERYGDFATAMRGLGARI